MERDDLAMSMATSFSSRRILLVSFLVDILDVLTNLLVDFVTGSAVRTVHEAFRDGDRSRLPAIDCQESF